MTWSQWNDLNQRIVDCEGCDRLRAHCRSIGVTKRKAYLDWDYWAGPVPNFGDPSAQLLIVGLAPGAHGANRTGRMFTGDRSGDWLYRALARAGFSNQESSLSRNDGLTLNNCAITAVCHCAPPDNKPTRPEIERCQPFLDQTVELLQPLVFLALGQIAWRASLHHLAQRKWLSKTRPKFSHGGKHILANGSLLIGSYHPSQQNTFTGRLTEPMLDSVFQTINDWIEKRSS
ncbi:MAG: uracil-DNA glycosylase [Planctomycetaceae bacterium]|nr:uracil-DNA glycosylase [Planctomycetaceae bacterium]